MNFRFEKINKLEYKTILLENVYLDDKLKGYIFFDYKTNNILFIGNNLEESEYYKIQFELEVLEYLEVDNYNIKKLEIIKKDYYLYGNDNIKIKRYDISTDIINEDSYISVEFYLNNELIAFIEKEYKIKSDLLEINKNNHKLVFYKALNIDDYERKDYYKQLILLVIYENNKKKENEKILYVL
jgi:hypothetical protein